MFYLTTHSTHFIYGWLCGVGPPQIVRDETGCRHMGYSKGSFICTIPTDWIAHTMAFGTPVLEHWLDGLG